MKYEKRNDAKKKIINYLSWYGFVSHSFNDFIFLFVKNGFDK